MPFICENVTNAPLYKKAATGFAKDHIKIRPLSRPRTSLGNELVLKSCFMPMSYRKSADVISAFYTDENDVWILGFPKTGTSYVQELVWLILNGCDFEKAKMFPCWERSPLIEESLVKHPNLLKYTKLSMDLTKRLAGPRVIKSHLPVALLPTTIWRTKPKLIYVARNPKDIIAEYYQEYVLRHGYQGTISDFVELLLGDSVMYAPFHSHITDFWAMKDEPNIMFATYEDDVEDDVYRFIGRLSEFLGKPLSEEQVYELANYVEQLKKTPVSKDDLAAMDKLWKRVRKQGEEGGAVGGNGLTLETLTEDLTERIDEWNTTNLLHTDFRFNN